MQLFRGATAVEVLAVRLDTGEDVVRSLNQVIEDAQLVAGSVVSGSGYLEQIRLEVPANLLWPPAVYAVEKNGPGQIVSAQGHIVDGKIDLQMSVAKRGEVFAGTVLPDARVLHYAEFVILRAGQTRWGRVSHPETGVPQFQATMPPPQQPAPPLLLLGRPVDPAALALVPTALIRKHACLPVARSGDTLVVAMTDPNNPFAIDDLREATGLRIQAVGVDPRDLMPVVQQVLGRRL